jgi:hypothetical protein
MSLQFLKLLLGMDSPNLDNLVLSSIISAYQATYNPIQLQSLGLIISTNTPASKTMSVNSLNPIYPEIVIWKPDNSTLQTGKTILVAAIETSNTINMNINKWQRLAAISVIFNLVVPEFDVERVKKILADNKIPVTNLQFYRFNKDNKYEFYKAQ